MSKYYTHGSIENISYDFSKNRIKLHIKPLCEFEVVVDKKRYLVFVNDPERDYFGFLVSTKEGFTVGGSVNNMEDNTRLSGQINGQINGQISTNGNDIQGGNDSIFLTSILPYWLNNKTKLKFTVSEDTEDKTKLSITSIEPIE